MATYAPARRSRNSSSVPHERWKSSCLAKAGSGMAWGKAQGPGLFGAANTACAAHGLRSRAGQWTLQGACIAEQELSWQK